MGDLFRLVVIGDSTAFTGDRGPLMPSDPTVYPNVAAGMLSEATEREVAVTVLATPGADTRDAWRMLTKDRHAQFDVLVGADAVIVGVGSFDHAPMGIPAAVEAVVPYLRPASVRRRARLLLRAAHPMIVRATGGRLSHTPLGEFTRMYDAVLLQVRSLARGAAGVVLGPTSHRSPYYGNLHPQREDRERIQFAIAARHGFPCVASWPLVAPHADHLNPDGIHWPAEAHRAVGEALGRALAAQLTGATPVPPTPGFAPGFSSL